MNFPNTSNKPYESPDGIDLMMQKISEAFFSKKCETIIEVTYAYAELPNGSQINKTLYGTFLNEGDQIDWVRFAENLDVHTAELEQELFAKKGEIDGFRTVLSASDPSDQKVQLLLSTLDYIENIFDIVLLGLPFEAEKAGLPMNLSAEEVGERTENIERIEAKLFGGNVRDNRYEVIGSYKMLSGKYQEKKERLMLEEQERFEKYLHRITELPIFEESKQDISVDHEVKTIEIVDTPWKNMKIPREKYVQIFKLVFEIYGIEKPVLIDDRSAIYDGPQALHIPSNDLYATLSVERVLALIAHEIETHYVIEDNNTQIFGTFRGAGNLEREEGLAIFSEKLLAGDDIEGLSVSASIPPILVGELLDGEEFKDFLGLYEKLTGATAPFLRRKRNYSAAYRGVQHKDTSYSRGLHKVVEYVKNGGDIKDLYVGKVAFQDVELAKSLAEKQGLKTKYPILLGELLQYALNGNEVVERDFLLHLSQKYPFLNVEQELKQGTIMKLIKEQKGKILQILSLIRD